MTADGTSSKYFSRRALKGLNRIGDILIPRNGDLPSFSEYGGAARVDDILAYAPAADVSTLNTVLGVFSVLPGGMLKWLAGLMESSPHNEGSLGSLLRQLNLGLRGLLFSIYYAGKAGPGYHGKHPMEIIGYVVNRVED